MDMTPGMKDPKRNTYLHMPIVELRREISALETTVRCLMGSPSPKTVETFMDANHRLRFANAAMEIRGELR